MKRVHIIGGKNHGKTTLVVELVSELKSRGLCVGTIKHTHHEHELDIVGKDSHRHREAGAEIAGILSRSMNAVFWPNDGHGPDKANLKPDDRYQAFETIFASCDLVLVEGDTRTSAPKLEVWRAVNGTPPIAETNEKVSNIRAIVTDDLLEASSFPLLSRSYVASIAEFILNSL